MTFTLTISHLTSFLSPCTKGEWEPFLSAFDTNVHWVIGDSDPEGQYPLGVYVLPLRLPTLRLQLNIFSPKQNVESWKEKIRAPLAKALATPLKMVVDEMDVIGLKAIVECSGYATQKNGKPYNNK
jgi:hypothetical protein